MKTELARDRFAERVLHNSGRYELLRRAYEHHADTSLPTRGVQPTSAKSEGDSNASHS